MTSTTRWIGRLAPALAAATCLAVPQPARAATLVSHFEFDGDTTNSVGGAPDGAIVGGASGIGAGFLGTGSLSLAENEYFDMTAGGFPNNAGVLGGTVAFWVKTAPNLTNAQIANKTLLGSVNQNDSMALLWGTNGVGNMQLFPRAAAGGQYRLRLTPGGDVFALERSWADGQWRHLAVTWQAGATGGDFVGSIYIDGVEIQTGGADFTLDTADPTSAWEFPLTLGGRNNRGTVDQFLPGGMMIDDYRVYDGPLTAAEIARLAVPEPTAAGLLACGVLAAVGRRHARAS